jgi:four helix bundle protein
MNKGNPAFEKAYALAIRIVNAYKHFCDQKREFVSSKQLLRSGTSIGANLAEARDQQSLTFEAYQREQKTGSRLKELTQVLPVLSYDQIKKLVAVKKIGDRPEWR